MISTLETALLINSPIPPLLRAAQVAAWRSLHIVATRTGAGRTSERAAEQLMAGRLTLPEWLLPSDNQAI
jgi:hypothetical protein